jgi:acetoin utilization protein AcuB
MTVDEIMTPAPVFTSSKATLGQALRLLQQLELRHLPVVDDGRLVGMLSDRDLRTALGPSFESGSAVSNASLEAAISSIMSAAVVSVSPETEVPEVIDLMLEHRVGAIPVAGDEEDQLLGIVSYVDVLRAARDLF